MTPHPITVALTLTTRQRVDLLVATHKYRAERTADAYRRRKSFHLLTLTEQRKVTAAIRDNARKRRAAGKLLDTQDVLLTEAVRHELIRRGLDPQCPAELEPGADLPGRWPGVGDRLATERISASIPRAYMLAVTAEAWRLSAEHIAGIKAWDYEHPEYNGFRSSVEPEALAEREALASRLTSPGDIYRDALDAITSGITLSPAHAGSELQL